MGSYEEWVVDRSVDAAWLEFRVRLADHLSTMAPDDVLALGLRDAHDDWIVELAISTLPTGFRALWEWADERSRPGARHGRSIRIAPEQIDAYVLVIRDVLESAGAPHPSFVEVLSGGLVLVDPPEQIVATAAEPEIPELVTPTSSEDLISWVDRVISARLGYPPRKRDDGSISLSRGDDIVTIRISRSRPIIEVGSTVARDVDVRRARKAVARLNARFHFFSFSLVGDRLLMSTTVNASPFCPEHLDRAIDSTFTYLADEAGKVRVKVARKAPKDASTDNAVDTDLLLVYGAAGDRKVMIEMARRLTGDSRTSLGQWRRTAAEAGNVAKTKAANAKHGPVQNALTDQVIAWRGVAEAITEAVAEIADERRAAR